MGKIIAAINMTLDGFCNHDAVEADEETHQHYADLLKGAEAILFGRITFELMTYWQTVVENPTGERGMDEFATIIDRIPKVVFSRTLQKVDWGNTELKREIDTEAILSRKRSSSKAILVGSPSMIVAMTQLDLIDEYQICVHPRILGTGLPLFKNIEDSVTLKLLHTKTFKCGAIILYYDRVRSVASL